MAAMGSQNRHCQNQPHIQPSYHATITRDSYEDWIFSAQYMSPNPCKREIEWTALESIQQPWLVAGDLNDIAGSAWRRGTAPGPNNNRIRAFANRIKKCKLKNLGFSGPKFTWNNGQQGLANIQKRLDRGLCNTKWRALFPPHLPWSLSFPYSRVW